MSRDGCLVSLLLILSFSLSPALADRPRSKGLEHEVLRCIDECDNTDIREYLLCQRDCELKHGEHQAEEEQQYGRRRLDPRWQVEDCNSPYSLTFYSLVRILPPSLLHLMSEEEREQLDFNCRSFIIGCSVFRFGDSVLSSQWVLRMSFSLSVRCARNWIVQKL